MSRGERCCIRRLVGHYVLSVIVLLAGLGLFGETAGWASEDISIAVIQETISAGWYHSCGVKTDGTVDCWGYNSQGQSTAPSGTFVQVSAGLYHSCGVRTDGTLDCWGRNDYGQAPDVSVAPSSLPDGTLAYA